MDMIIPPLWINIMLESNLLKPTMLVGRLGVVARKLFKWGSWTFLPFLFLFNKTKHDLNLEGWNFQAHREFPRKFEPSNVSRGNVSREIGRTCEWAWAWSPHGHARAPYWDYPCRDSPTQHFPGDSPWTWEFHPLKFGFCLSQPLWRVRVFGNSNMISSVNIVMCVYIYIYIYITHILRRGPSTTEERASRSLCQASKQIPYFGVPSQRPATWKHGWSKYGSSIIPSKDMQITCSLKPCLLQPCYHIAGTLSERSLRTPWHI